MVHAVHFNLLGVPWVHIYFEQFCIISCVVFLRLLRNSWYFQRIQLSVLAFLLPLGKVSSLVDRMIEWFHQYFGSYCGRNAVAAL